MITQNQYRIEMRRRNTPLSPHLGIKLPLLRLILHLSGTQRPLLGTRSLVPIDSDLVIGFFIVVCDALLTSKNMGKGGCRDELPAVHLLGVNGTATCPKKDIIDVPHIVMPIFSRIQSYELLVTFSTLE